MSRLMYYRDDETPEFNRAVRDEMREIRKARRWTSALSAASITRRSSAARTNATCTARPTAKRARTPEPVDWRRLGRNCINAVIIAAALWVIGTAAFWYRAHVMNEPFPVDHGVSTGATPGDHR